MKKDFTLSIHVQNACNSECTFCIVDAAIWTRAIPQAEIESILDDHRDIVPNRVNFHGGEPTIRADLIDIVRSVRSRGYGTSEISVQTNGRRLADLGYAQALIDAGVNLLVVSLHGHNARIQDETSRRTGSFREAVEGIRNARALGCAVRTNSVVARNNYQYLPELVDLLAELDVNVVNISALHTASQAVTETFLEVVPHYSNVRSHLVEAVQRAERHGIPVILEGFPLCVYPESVERHLHLLRDQERIRMYFRGKVIEDYDVYMDRIHRTRGPPCEGCTLREKCAGAYREYVDQYGWDEFEDDEFGTRRLTHPRESSPERDRLDERSRRAATSR